MAIEGELWTTIGQSNINSNNIRKWLYGSVLIRDWDPAGTTSLAGVSPFESDGSLSTTLFSADNPGGPWFDVGAIDANGVDFTPRYKTVDTDIWQSRLPQRTDVDGDGEDIMVNLSETNAVALALFNNQPLVNTPGTGATSVLQGVGALDFSVEYSIWPQIIYRQLLIIGVDGETENPLYVAELRPRVSLTKLDKRQFSSKKPDEFGVSFGVYVDPASGYAKKAIYGGPAWLALGGPIGAAGTVTATAVSGGTGAVSLSFPVPTGNASPFVYTVQAIAQTSGSVIAATVGTPTVSTGTVTLPVTGLTPGTEYELFVIATGSNGLAGTYAGATVTTSSSG